jgi:hypothetical protein
LDANSLWSQTTDCWNSSRDSANYRIIKHNRPNTSATSISTSYISKALTIKLQIVCQDITRRTNPMKNMMSMNMFLQIEDSTQTAKNFQEIFDSRQTALPPIQLSVLKSRTRVSINEHAVIMSWTSSPKGHSINSFTVYTTGATEVTWCIKCCHSRRVYVERFMKYWKCRY